MMMMMMMTQLSVSVSVSGNAKSGQLPQGGRVGIVCSVIFCLLWHPISFLYATYWVWNNAARVLGCVSGLAQRVSLSLSVCLPPGLSLCLSVCQFACLSVSLAYGISNFKAFSPTTTPTSSAFILGRVYIVRAHPAPFKLQNVSLLFSPANEINVSRSACVGFAGASSDCH